MSKYSSDAKRINHNINTIFQLLSNPSVFKGMINDNIDKLPEDAKANLDKIKFCDDHIEIESPMGPISMGIDKAKTTTPSCITFGALNSPIKAGLVVNLKEVDADSTDAVATIDVDLPFMVATMVGGQLKEAANKLGEMLKMIPYDKLQPKS